MLGLPLEQGRLRGMSPNRLPPLAPAMGSGLPAALARFDASASQSPPLTGRTAQLQQLHAWLDDAAPLSGLALWGAAGVGKSRLALELAQEASRSGWAVLRLPHQDAAQERDADMDCADPGWVWPLGQSKPMNDVLLVVDDVDQYLCDWDDLAHSIHRASQDDPSGASFRWRLLLIGRAGQFVRKAQHMFRGQEMELKPFADPQTSWQLYAAAAATTAPGTGYPLEGRAAMLAWLAERPMAGVPALLLAAAACQRPPALARLRRPEDWATTLAAEIVAQAGSAAEAAGLERRPALLWLALAQLANGFRPGTGPELEWCGIEPAALGLPAASAVAPLPILSHSLPCEALCAYVFFQIWDQYLANDDERAALLWAGLTTSRIDPARTVLRMQRFARFLQHLHTEPPWIALIRVPPDLCKRLAPHLARFDDHQPPLPHCVEQIYQDLFFKWRERVSANPDIVHPAPEYLHWSRWCATLSFQRGEPWFRQVNSLLEQLTERDQVGYAPDYARMLSAATRMSACYRQWSNAERLWAVAEKYYLIAVEAGRFELGREWVNALLDLETYCSARGDGEHAAIFGERSEAAALLLAKYDLARFGSFAEEQLDLRFTVYKKKADLASMDAIETLFPPMLEVQSLLYQAAPNDPSRALRYAALLSASAIFVEPAEALQRLRQAEAMLGDGPKHAELKQQIRHALLDFGAPTQPPTLH
jgi:hypothetical protein